MGLFSFLSGKKKDSLPESLNVTISATNDSEYWTPKYYELLTTNPNMFEFYGRSYDFPKYNDSYITQEGYKLRELLLLVWWGRTKTGRKSTITIPKYFFFTYNLNAEKLTKQFKEKGLLIDDGEKTVLTEEGRKISDKYIDLWDIHSVKQYPTNLDIDFPTWNKDKFDLMLYQAEIRYYNANALFCNRMIEYFNSLTPSKTQKAHNEINYYINERNSDLAKVADLKEKVTILQDRIENNN